MTRMRLAIGDVYKVSGKEDLGARLDYTFEIIGEEFIDGQRFVVGAKHRMHPSDEGAIVVFDERGRGETLDGGCRWVAWEVSRANPRYRAPTGRVQK